MRGKEKGFTLIELMIVVAIIGILIAIVLPRLTGLIDLSRERSTMKNLKNIYAALYYQSEEMQNGVWPVTSDEVYAYLKAEYGTPTGGGNIPQTLPKAKYQRKYRIPDSNKIVVGNIVELMNHNNPLDTANVGGWFYCNDTTDAVNFGKVFCNFNGLDSRGINYTEYPCR